MQVRGDDVKRVRGGAGNPKAPQQHHGLVRHLRTGTLISSCLPYIYEILGFRVLHLRRQANLAVTSSVRGRTRYSTIHCSMERLGSDQPAIILLYCLLQIDVLAQQGLRSQKRSQDSCCRWTTGCTRRRTTPSSMTLPWPTASCRCAPLLMPYYCFPISLCISCFIVPFSGSRLLVLCCRLACCVQTCADQTHICSGKYCLYRRFKGYLQTPACRPTQTRSASWWPISWRPTAAATGTPPRRTSSA